MAVFFDNAVNPMAVFSVNPNGQIAMKRGFSICGWVRPKFVTGNGGSMEFMGWNDNAASGETTAWIGIETAASKLRVVSNYGADQCTVNLPWVANKWHFFGFAFKPRRYYDTNTFQDASGLLMVSPVDDENIYSTYVDDVGNTWPGNFNNGSYGVLNRIQIGSPAWMGAPATGNYCSNADMALFKIWNSVLNLEELANEKWSYAPQRTRGLFAFYPFNEVNAAAAIEDYSGNGNDLTFTGSFSNGNTIDNPPVGIGQPYQVMTSVVAEETYGLNYSTKTNAGISAAPFINLGPARAGETQILSLSYKQATVVTTPAGDWTVIADTISGSVRNTVFKRIVGNDQAGTTITFTLGASSEWSAIALTTTGRVGNVANVTTAQANIVTAPTITIPTVGDYWLSIFTNVQGNAKLYFNNSDSNVSVIATASANSNVVAGIGQTMALRTALASGVTTAGNLFHIYEGALGTGTMANLAPLTQYKQGNVFDSIQLNNNYASDASSDHECNFLWKRDAANCLNYNTPFTVMFDYFHVPAFDGTYRRQQLWTLTRIPGAQYAGVYAYDALLIDDNGYFNLRRAQAGYNYFDETTANQEASVGKWHHITIVSDSNLKISYYVNGILGQSMTVDPATRTAVNAPGGTVSQSNYEFFGMHQRGEGVGDNQYFTGAYNVLGAFSNIKEWSRALSDGEILEEMANKAPRSTANLFAWYPLESANSFVPAQMRDYVGTKHLMVNKGTVGSPGPVSAPTNGPVRNLDITLAVSLTITPAVLKRGLVMTTGNIGEVAVGSEKSGNILTLLVNGEVRSSNIRAADFYVNLPSGRPLVIESGNLRVLNANTDILIR